MKFLKGWNALSNIQRFPQFPLIRVMPAFSRPAPTARIFNVKPRVARQAREEMEFAGESKETTYFDEEAAAAKEAVDGKKT